MRQRRRRAEMDEEGGRERDNNRKGEAGEE